MGATSTDDNFGLGSMTSSLCEELVKRRIDEELAWFIQARCDDIVRSKALLPKLREAGNIWMLVGFDHPNPETMKSFRRKNLGKAKAEILCQGTFVIGERNDSHETIQAVRDFADWLDPDLATFMTLTPFPGTEIYETAKQNGWIEDTNWSNYDMIHAIMPTKYLTREEVQQELHKCYRTFFGSWKRRHRGLFSENTIIRRTYQYLARKAILTGLRSLF